MERTAQFCPVAKAAQVFCERWTPLILHCLGSGSTRFSQLCRDVPLMSRSMLTRRLQLLEREGIIERRPNPAGRGSTYHLTGAGREFLPVIEALGDWGQRWSRRQLAEGEVDVELLVWAMERDVRPEAFGDRRTVVQLDFVDQPSNRRRWWFINDPGEVQLCLQDPGFEPDLYLSVPLRDMVDLWRGDLPPGRALRSHRLEAVGPPTLRRALPSWFARPSVVGRRQRAGAMA